MKNVRVRDQVLASIGLHRLIEEAFGSEAVPIRRVQHLLGFVELLDVLCKSVTSGVGLATMFTCKLHGLSDITEFRCHLKLG